MPATGMDKIREAILAKVEAEARDIVGEAEARAQEEIERAKKQREIRLQEEKRKTLEDAEREGARIIAQASITARQNLSGAKADAIARIVSGVKNKLAETSADESFSPSLIAEAIDGLGGKRGELYVPPRHAERARALIKGDKKLAAKIEEVKELDCMGGAIAEDVEGKLRIDNTFETRLDMLLPRLLPEISRDLFKRYRDES